MGDFLLSVTSYLTGIRLPYFTWSDIVEILLIAFFVYEFMLWIRNTRAYSLLKGILIVLAFIFIAFLLKMNTILWLVTNMAGYAITAVLIIFQPELRKALEELGHKKIGYLSSALGSHIMQIRHKAFFHALKQNGLKSDPTYAGSSYYITQCMEKHLPRFLENGITAIICNQDTLASATLTQCQQLGFQIPDDISIIGFDDLPIAACTSPPLTTIRQDRLELGKSGFFALSSLLNHIPISTYLLHAQLIQRESTGKVPS